ncbi:MAG: PIG-L family deacetylase [Candidatus Dormibacteraeota bacterium]|nr:PIG-L family deacetylase [Candidatus Dormibacteraeota bacterium]
MATLLLVHAHPDDETIATGGVMMRAHADGHRVVLVTCTRGEEGEIHNMDEAATRPRLAEVRTEELRRAGKVLGVDRQEFLGYRDSGMAGTSSNDNPASFHRAPLPEAAERLAAVLRDERPEVVVTYTSDGTYGHPDHIKAHHTTVAALDLMEREGWQPVKFYLSAVPRSFVQEMEVQAREAGIEMQTGGIQLIGIPDEEITTKVDVRGLAQRKREAFSAHLSQNDPNSPMATAAGQIFESAFGVEYFVLARGELGEEHPERSLFEGV